MNACERRDMLNASERSELMRRIKRRDTAPELILRRALWAAGVRGWRVDWKRALGRPDLAWPRLKLAVFVDGAFWHGHPDHYRGQSGEFWDEKIRRNRERDALVNEVLEQQGWTVIRFWDFQVTADVAVAVHAVLQELDRLRN